MYACYHLGVGQILKSCCYFQRRGDVLRTF